MKTLWLAKAGKVLLIVAIKVLVFGFIVMGLWNALVPELFHGPHLGFWQAAGILVLSHLLLRGWGAPPGWHREHWRQRFEEKLASMAPEEREKFKEEWKRRCGWHPMESEEKRDEHTKQH